MKKIVLKLLIVIGIAVSYLHAQPKALTMQNMVDGINLVQLGFLTNTESMIQEGVLEIKNSADILLRVKYSSFPSLNEVQTIEYTKKGVDKLKLTATELLEKFKDGNVSVALEKYNSIMSQCIKCHVKLRDYKDRGYNFK